MMHKSSYSKMKWFKDKYLDKDIPLRILDVGSFDKYGTYNYKPLFTNEKLWTYEGLDIIDGYNVDIVIEDIYDWSEIEDCAYDVIISGQFFEHLEYFWIVMANIKRVLKHGGFLCIIAPSSGPKHGNLIDCYRFSENSFRALANYVDLKIIDVSESDVEPWHDVSLIAKKSGNLMDQYSNFENEINQFFIFCVF